MGCVVDLTPSSKRWVDDGRIHILFIKKSHLKNIILNFISVKLKLSLADNCQSFLIRNCFLETLGMPEHHSIHVKQFKPKDKLV